MKMASVKKMRENYDVFALEINFLYVQNPNDYVYIIDLICRPFS
jgi:hypothetical protein